MKKSLLLLSIATIILLSGCRSGTQQKRPQQKIEYKKMVARDEQPLQLSSGQTKRISGPLADAEVKWDKEDYV